jgi:F-box and leucine-rich repeat protein 7
MSVSCEIFKKDQKIVSINEDADCMFFILSGSVVVLGPTDIVHAEMKAGASFGEVGILLDTKRTASIKAKEECKMFKLTKANLMSVIKKYPETHAKLVAVAEERYLLFIQRTSSNSSSTKVESEKNEVCLFDMEVSIQNLSRVSISSCFLTCTLTILFLASNVFKR